MAYAHSYHPSLAADSLHPISERLAPVDFRLLGLEAPHLHRLDPVIHPLSDLHLRNRGLGPMSWIHDPLHDLTLRNHQIERESAIALEEDYRWRYASALGAPPIFDTPYDGTPYGSRRPYPSLGLANSVHHHGMFNPVLMEDPYYSQIASTLPRSLPMFSDPYFMPGILSSGSGYANGVYPHGYSIQNPFIHGIDYDYGYGVIQPLTSYGLRPEMLHHNYGQALDDLYLFELMLRLDQTLDESQRLLMWQERLAWEELDLMERRLRWQQMSMLERSRLGLAMGSYWGNQFGGLPIDSTFGYINPVMGIEVMPRPFGSAPIMGVLDSPHYPLSAGLMSQYPMWSSGGLGLGGRISPWLGGWDGYLRPKDIIRQENIRREYAERRGEIPPGPRLVEPHKMTSGLPLYERFL